MIEVILGVLTLGLGVGIGLWWGSRRPPEQAHEPPAEVPPVEGLVVQGVEDPRELWVRAADGWIPLASPDRRTWVPAPRAEPDDPDSQGFPPLLDWVREVRRDPEVRRRLEGWTEATVAASRVAWVTGIPTGDLVLESWARQAVPSDDPGAAFARWLVGQLGRASRWELTDRTVAEHRGPTARGLHVAAARLVAALDPEVELEVDPPAGVGPRDRERWLIDAGVAERLGNPGPVIHPVVVLRPKVARGGQVLLEGEVA